MDNGQTENQEKTTVPSLEGLLGKTSLIDRNAEEPKTEEEATPPNSREEVISEPNTPPSTTRENEPNESNEPNELLTYLQSLNNDNISEEDLNYRNDLLNIFNGAYIDDKGNIVSTDGNISANLEDIEAYIENGGLYDKYGNLTLPNGDVIKTKEELKTTFNGFDELYKEIGYELKDEEGNIKEYSKDIDGLKDYISDVTKQLIQDYNNKLFQNYPQLEDVYKHVLAGGSIENYTSTQDYSRVDLNTLTDEQKLFYIRQSFKESGMSDARIERNLSRIQQANDIDAEAIDALEYLQDIQDRKKQDRDREIARTIEQNNQKVINYWNSVNETISKGKLKNINIPKEEQEAFFNYLARPVKEDKSQEMLDREAEDLTSQLELAYLRFKKFDLSKLVTQKANNVRIDELRRRMSEYRSSDNVRKKPKNNSLDVNKISLNNIIK